MSTPSKKPHLIHGHSINMPAGFGLILSVIFFLAQSATAATHYVTVNGSSFSPATLTIVAGDTVSWENTDEFFSHSTTSDLDSLNPDYWNGWLINQSDTFDRLFDHPGTFTYHDQFDAGTGTITVNAPTTTPVILLETPRLEGGQFLFDATGLTVGKTNIVQASTNLTDWVPVTTNIAATASLTFTNSITPPQRFFRLLELP